MADPASERVFVLTGGRTVLEAAEEHGVPMPVAAAAQQVVQALMGFGYDDIDFMALLELEARGSSLELEPENVPVGDGLSDGQFDMVPARPGS